MLKGCLQGQLWTLSDFLGSGGRLVGCERIIPLLLKAPDLISSGIFGDEEGVPNEVAAVCSTAERASEYAHRRQKETEL